MAEAIYSSETAPAPRRTSLPARRVPSAGGGRAPRTEYVLVTPKGQQQRTPGYRVSYQGRTPQNPRLPGIPQWMTNKEIIFGAWLGTMLIVSLDDWKIHGVLPRPMRLWYTSGVFFILAGLSVFDILAPLMSLFAVGFFFAVLWQYLTQSGQFAPGAGTAGEAQVSGPAGEGGAGSVRNAMNNAGGALAGTVNNVAKIIENIVNGATSVTKPVSGGPGNRKGGSNG